MWLTNFTFMVFLSRHYFDPKKVRGRMEWSERRTMSDGEREGWRRILGNSFLYHVDASERLRIGVFILHIVHFPVFFK